MYSTQHFHAHELAHEYVFRAWGGWSNGLLNEGEAVALSCDPFYAAGLNQRPRDLASPSLSTVGWRDVLDLNGDSRAGYAAAGFFVSYLARRFGWSSVAELHRRVPPAVSAADFEREFARVYPLSMTQAWAEALDAPGALTCEMDWQCFGSPLEVDEDATPDCDGEFHRLFSVTSQPTVAIELTSSAGKSREMSLMDCEHPGGPLRALGMSSADRGTIHWVTLPEGSYGIMHGSGPLPSGVAFRAQQPSPLVGDGCETSPTVQLDSAMDTSIDFSAGVYTGWIRIAGGGRTYRVESRDLTWNEPLTAGPLALCDGCGPSSTCVALTGAEASFVDIADSAAVRLEGVFALPPNERTAGALVFGVTSNGEAD